MQEWMTSLVVQKVVRMMFYNIVGGIAFGLEVLCCFIIVAQNDCQCFLCQCSENVEEVARRLNDEKFNVYLHVCFH